MTTNKLDNHVRGVVKKARGVNVFTLEGEMLGYLRSQANLPYPTTKLSGVQVGNEGQQWLLRGDNDCDLVGIRVSRQRQDYDWVEHSFSLSVLYKRKTWEVLERRTAHIRGENIKLHIGSDGWKSIEGVLDEFADIILHLLDVYQVAVIK